MRASTVNLAEDTMLDYRKWFRRAAAQYIEGKVTLAFVRHEYRQYSAAKRSAWALRCPASQK